MPLLVSPIDNATPMQQIVRDGIEIDRCPVSGGVWLDRGELEKLLEAVRAAAAADREEFVAYRAAHPSRTTPPPPEHPAHARGYRYDDDYDDYYKRKYGKKSTLKSLLDIFD
jgi:hypothetical protein